MNHLLLEKDGISGKWDNEVDLLDFDEKGSTLTSAFRILENGEHRSSYDYSRMVVGNHTTDEDDCVEHQYTVNDAVDIEKPPGGIIDIHKM